MQYEFICTANDGKKFDNPYECACYEYRNCIDWKLIDDYDIKIAVIDDNCINVESIDKINIDEVISLSYVANLGYPTFYECIKYHLNGRKNAYLIIPDSKALSLILQYLGYDPYADFSSLHIGLNKFEFVEDTNVPISPYTAQPYLEHFI